MKFIVTDESVAVEIFVKRESRQKKEKKKLEEISEPLGVGL